MVVMGVLRLIYPLLSRRETIDAWMTSICATLLQPFAHLVNRQIFTSGDIREATEFRGLP
jgi:hypothetical protein